MSDLLRNLDIILEEERPNDGWHPLDSAIDLAKQLQDAQQLVADIQHKLSSIKMRMSGDLALALRRAKPGLNVAVDKNGCRVGYKTKYLQFIPEVENGIWKIISPNRRFLREFQQANRRATLLTADLSVIVDAITTYFTNYYRTLGEDIEGTGILIVEERRATLLELADWRNDNVDVPVRRLLTRMERRGVTC